MVNLVGAHFHRQIHLVSGFINKLLVSHWGLMIGLTTFFEISVVLPGLLVTITAWNANFHQSIIRTVFLSSQYAIVEIGLSNLSSLVTLSFILNVVEIS